MKVLIPLCAILTVCTARIVIDANGPISHHVLGREKCSWGPSYWCENIKTAAGCNATSHCIQIKWNNMKVPEDNDDVCQVCKDMVQQARDQLESNQTQSDLKAVFEGSCKLIHIKPIVKECITVVDQFIPELVETLASQMNPSVVCSVAGLCNSAHIDKLLEEYNQPTSKIVDVRSHSLEKDEIEPDDCTKCLTVAAHMEYKLNNSPRDRVLQNALRLCGELSTFTDACSATILTYFDTLFSHLQENFNSQNICHLSGQCTAQFHKHENSDANPKVEIRPLSSVGMVDVSDDLPCKLCEQLVQHLRDLLVANTTELEFHQVLDGLCKQTKSFKSECTTIVDEYYPEIYEYLTKNLNSNAVCQMSGMCPAPGKTVQNEPIWPLLPRNVEEIGVRIFQNLNKNVEPKKSEPLSKSEIEGMQLGIERMFPFPLSDGPVVNGKASCAICEYVMHYIQETLTNPVTEEEVEQALERVCHRLPGSITKECSEFVETYGDAVIAILIQEIDPAHVCGMLRLCPTKSFMKLWGSIPAKYTLAEKRDRPSCPLCLLAMTQIYNVIKNNRTQANIEAELDKLCNHLPQSLSQECTDLVQGYSKELVELLLADLTPIEVCTFIKLCKAPKSSHHKNIFVTDKNGEILTNEIPDAVQSDSEEWGEHEKKSAKVKKGLTCTVCKIANDKSKNKIGNAVRSACNHLPKSASKECRDFIEKSGGAVIDTFIKDISREIDCTLVPGCGLADEDELEVNSETPDAVQSDNEEWGEHEKKSSKLKKDLTCTVCQIPNDRSKNKIQNTVRSACNHLPKSAFKECRHFVDKYGDAVIDAFIKDVSPNIDCTVVPGCGLADEDELEVDSETPDVVSINSDEMKEYERKGIRVKQSVTCNACQLAVDYVENKVGSEKSRNKIENALLEACNHLPDFVSKECTLFVNKHGNSVINAFTNNVSPKAICTVVDACNVRAVDFQLEVNNETPKDISTNVNDLEEGKSRNVIESKGFVCETCKKAIPYIVKIIGSDESKNTIENAVHSVYKHVPNSISKECNHFIDKHSHAVIDALLKSIKPNAICSYVTACRRSATQEVVLKVNDATHNSVSDHSDEWQEDEKKSVGAQRSVLCQACKLAVQYVEEKVGVDKTRPKIENALREACGHLPHFARGECTKLVNEHGDSLINALENNVAPNLACSAARVCVKRAVGVEFQVNNETPDAVSGISDEWQADETKSVGAQRGVVCHACQWAVEYVEKKVGVDRTRPKIVHALHTACQHAPHVVRGECNKIVTEHGDAIVSALEKNVASKLVCTVARACILRSVEVQFQVNDETSNTVSDHSDEWQEDEKKSVGAQRSVLCQACKLAVQYVEEKVGVDKTRPKIENALREACGHLPHFARGECTKLVNEHGDSLINALENNVAPNLACSAARVCVKRAVGVEFQVNNETPDAVSGISDEWQADETKSVGAQRGVVCHACQWAVEYVEKKVGVDRTRPKIVHALHTACQHAPHVVRGECNKIVTEHGDAIVSALEKNVASKLVCTVARACILRSVEVQFQVNDETSNTVSDHSDEWQEDEKKSVGAQRSVLCQACKLAVQYVEEKVGVDKTRPKIENALREACGHLPHFARGECTKLVNEHGDSLINALENNVAPNLACSAARVCVKRAVGVEFQVNNETPDAVSGISDEWQADETKSVGAQRGVVCHACQWAVEYVEKKVGVDRTRPKIVHALHTACQHAPHVVRGECNKIVTEHGDAIVSALEKNVASKLVCTVARACILRSVEVQFQVNDETSNTVSDHSDEWQEDEKKSVGAQRSVLCQACKLAVQYVEEKVGVDKTRPKIENALREACGHLPHFARGECTKLVNEHGDSLINALENNVAPNLACSAARVCVKRAVGVEFQVNNETPDAVSGISDEWQADETKSVGAQRGVVCHACQWAVEYVEKKVGVDRTRPKIVHALHTACQHAPHVVRGECNKIVTEHGDAIVSALEKNVASKLVCTVARACILRSVEVQFQVNDETSNTVSDHSDEWQEDEKKSVGAQRSVLCQACKLAVQYVEEKVGVDKTRPKIENALREACGHLPHFARGECTKLVNEHGDSLINALENNVAPNLACSAARVCVKRAVGVEFQVNNETPDAVSGISDEWQADETKSVGAQRGVVCHACQWAVEYVEKKVGVDRTRPKIVHALHTACQHAPHVVRGECNKIVTEHGDAIVSALEKNVASKLVCTVARACILRSVEVQFQVNDETSNTVSDHSDEWQEDEKKSVGAQRSVLCQACKLAVQYVEEKVGVDKTRPKIENALREACGHLPHFARGECTKLVNEHGDSLINALENNVAPNLACSAARVCVKRAVGVEFQVNNETPDAVSGISDEWQADETKSVGAQRGVVCHACQWAVEYVEKKVGVDRTRPKIVHALHTACQHAPHVVRGECNKIVTEHGDAIVSALEKNVASKLVCTVARACILRSVEVQFQVNDETSNTVSDHSDEWQEDEKKSVGAQRSVLCQACKLAVQYVEEKVGVDKTRPKIENALREACGHLPHFARGECTKLVNEHGDSLINALENNVAPNLACSAARVCVKRAVGVEFQVNNETPDAVSGISDEWQADETKSVGAQRGVVCHACQWAVEYVEKKVGVDRTRPKIVHALHTACQHAPHVVRGECNKIVTEHGDAIVSALEKNVASKLVCTVARACILRSVEVQFQVNDETSNTVSDHSDEWQEDEKKSVGAQRSVLCQACKLAVQYVEEKVGVDKTRPKIENALREACGHLPHFARGECTKLVNEHGDSLINALENNVAPNLACSAARVCVKRAVGVEFQVNDETSNTVSDHSDEWQEDEKKSVGAQRSVLCQACKLAVQYVEEKVGVDKTRPKIENALREACGHLPHFARGECTKLVNEHGDSLINALENNVAPNLACSAARVCVKRAVGVEFQVNNETPDAVSGISDEWQADETKSVGAQRGVVCHACQWAVEYVEKKVGVDRTRPKIVHALHTACQHAPHVVRGECNKIVTEHGDAIVSALEKNVASKLVCTVARACILRSVEVQFQVNDETSNTVSDHSDEWQEDEKKSVGAQRSVLCQACKLAVQYVEEKVGVDKTRPKIENALREACGHLPHFARGECTKLVNEHGDSLINALENNVAPNLACSAARVCVKRAVGVEFQVNNETPDAVSGISDEWQADETKSVGAQRGVVCHACQWAVEYVEKKVGVDRTRPKIVHALHTACQHAPHVVRGECNKIVTEHGDAIVSALEKNVASKLVCTVARACILRSVEVQFQVNDETSNTVSDHSDEWQEDEKKSVGAQRSVLCQACKLAVQYVEEKVGVDKTRPKIENALREACGHLPHFARGECTKLVNEHGDSLINALENNVAPNLACSAARVCVKRAVGVEFQVNNETPDAVSGISDEWQADETKSVGAQRGVVCHACQWAVEYVEKKVGVDRTRPKIVHALHTACQHAPHVVRGECNKIVTEHGDAIVSALEKNVASKLVCTVARACILRSVEVQFQVNDETSNTVSDHSGETY